MTTGIYSINDKNTGECLYVGQSKDIEYRWKQHLSKLVLGTHLNSFCTWFVEMGSDVNRLQFNVLEVCSNEDEIKNSLEIKWFKSLTPKFYGKEPSINDKWEHSSETKLKIGRKSSKPPTFYILVCEKCSKVFWKKSYERKYCSKRCSEQGTWNKERRKPKRKITVPKEKIHDLYWTQDLSLPEVARRLDISVETVVRIMDEYKIPRRTTSSGRNKNKTVYPKAPCPTCGRKVSTHRLEIHRDVCYTKTK